MSHVFGARSERELVGVKPRLALWTRRVLVLSPQDFAVTDGLRTREEQAEFVRRGASQTMNSKHLTGDAVDLVPYLHGKPRWEWSLIFPIAEAARKAAEEMNLRIRWGGCWEVLNGTTESPAQMVTRYVMARRAAGKKAFTDGPHYELV